MDLRQALRRQHLIQVRALKETLAIGNAVPSVWKPVGKAEAVLAGEHRRRDGEAGADANDLAPRQVRLHVQRRRPGRQGETEEADPPQVGQVGHQRALAGIAQPYKLHRSDLPMLGIHVGDDQHLQRYLHHPRILRRLVHLQLHRVGQVAHGQSHAIHRSGVGHTHHVAPTFAQRHLIEPKPARGIGSGAGGYDRPFANRKGMEGNRQ